jgi:NTP pyrophosphatase (non-canonical NTP hydrolase)
VVKLYTLSQTWLNIQTSLFPWLSEELGELTDKQQELKDLSNACDVGTKKNL